MLTESYVSFETAKLLKEKGFDVECYDFYEQEICGVYDYDVTTPQQKHSQKYKPINWNNEDDDSSIVCSRPSQSLALKWLREVHNIHISAQPDYPSKTNYKLCWCWTVDVLHKDCFEHKKHQCYIDTYEQAVEAAIKYTLENLI